MWRVEPSLQPKLISTTALLTVSESLDISCARATGQEGRKRFNSWYLTLEGGGCALIYSSGKVVVVGCKEPDTDVGLEIARKLKCSLISPPVISNYVFSGHLGRKIDLDKTMKHFVQQNWLCSHERELFPALFINKPGSKATLQFFRSGKYIITGIKHKGEERSLFTQGAALVKFE